jgi:hypothetical protein
MQSQPELNSELSKIDFYNVLDNRVMQSKSIKYPVIRSNTAVNTVKVDANSATQALLSFQSPYINPNMDLDRVVRVRGTLYFNAVCQNTAQIASGSLATNYAVVPGVNIAPSSFPFHQGVAACTFNCNNSNVVNVPLAELKDLLQRLADYKDNMKLHSGPSCVDFLTKYDDGFLSGLNSLANINDVDALSGFVGNGVWDLQVGVAAAGAIAAVPYNSTGLTWAQMGAPAGADLVTNSNLNFTVKLSFDEVLMLPPFVYNIVNAYQEPSFTGVSNFNLNIQMNTGSRCLRAINNAITSSSITTVSFQPSLFGAQTEIPKLEYTLIDKPLSFALERPVKPMYPFLNFIREVKTMQGLAAGASLMFESNQINMTRIPRYMVLGIRPNTIPQNYSDFLYALSETDGALNITWNTVPGKCSTLTKKNLFGSSMRNGIQDPYILWSGKPVNKRAYNAGIGVAASFGSGVGGWIVLVPGIDFDVPIDQAPGSVGQFSMSVQMNVYNQSDLDQSVAGANASTVNFYTWLIYDDVFQIDTLTQTTNILTGLVNPNIIENTDKNKPAMSVSGSNDEFTGGSLLRNFKAQHKHHGNLPSGGALSGGKVSGGSIKRF